jgi:predicted nucleic acid-binding protein
VHAVFDASVFVRAFVPVDPGAVEWIRRAVANEISVAVPELVFVEIGNALRTYVRETRLTLDGALRRIAFVERMPLDVRAHRRLVAPAVDLALSQGLSVYDACYAVLADVEGAVLVTADRRLAAAVARAELV